MSKLGTIVARCVLGCVLVAGLATRAAAEVEKRVALVIGNGTYSSTVALPNPVADAKGVSAALKRLGFTVIDGFDLDVASMRLKLKEFAEALPDSKAALVYYAGHGVSMDEENYLIPTDLALKTHTDIELNAVPLTLILKQMKREERVNVVILDACRDNPFAAELQRSAGRTRSAVSERGLSRIETDLAKGTLIAFATDPKATALDGKPGENSPFTKALLRHIEEPNIPIDTVMNRVRADVWEDTKQKQMPWVNTSIIGEFKLNPAQVAALPTQSPGAAPLPVAVAGSTPAAERLAQENKMWDSAERGNTADDYKAYLDAYPNGVYAQMARGRIARLVGPGGGGAAEKPTVSLAALKAEVGTMATEKALKLDPKARKEIQQRLKVMEYDPGNTAGNFNDRTRKAIAEWQKKNEVQETGLLGPVQRAAIFEQSEEAWQRQANAQPMVPVTRALTRAPPPPRVAPAIAAAQKSRAPQQPKPRQAGAGANPLGGVGAFIGGMAVGGALGGLLRR